MKKTKFFGALLAFAALSGTMTSCKVEADTDDSGKSSEDVAYEEEMQGVSVTGFENGYTYVDLGLESGVKWSTYNVGADQPEEAGDLYAWGETVTKSTFAWSNYKYGTSKTSVTKYCLASYYGTVDSKQTLEAKDDVASTLWGGNWRMPTDDEASELIDGCTWERTEDFNGTGVAGMIGTSKKNGNTIFLATNGYNESTYIQHADTYLAYWTSSLAKEYSDSGLCFGCKTTSTMDHYLGGFRFAGHGVRAVMD